MVEPGLTNGLVASTAHHSLSVWDLQRHSSERGIGLLDGNIYILWVFYFSDNLK